MNEANMIPRALEQSRGILCLAPNRGGPGNPGLPLGTL